EGRIEARLENLAMLVLLGRYALLRHLGYWHRVTSFMGEHLHTSFDPAGFASLLTVVARALRQVQVLMSPAVRQSPIRLPSLEITSPQFNSSECIWYHINPGRVTKETGKATAAKCLDPVLDLQLMNYSPIACIIPEIIFRHYGTWTE